MNARDSEALVRYERQEFVGTITLNRSDKLHAINLRMLDALEQICRQVDEDDQCRVIILKSTEERAFSAGADIKEWAGMKPVEMWRQWTRRGQRVFDSIAGLLQPTIAVVDGIAFGGGLELALACDLVFATDRARFAFPEVTIGTLPGWGGTARLAQRVGLARAKYMILTGTPVEAATALNWGLVEQVLDSRAEVTKEVEQVAKTISQNAPIAVALAKQALRNTPGSQSDVAIIESIASGLTAHTDDGLEGLASFRDKRKAEYRGF